MYTLRNNSNRQEGSVIVIVMIVLALLTIIGISAASMSTTELKIANNDANYKKAFYHAESGVYSVAKWIHQVNDDGEVPEAGSGNNFFYLDKDESDNDDLDQLMAEVMGYPSEDEDEDGMDIMFTMASPKKNSTVNVDLYRCRTIHLEGSTAASLGEGTSSVGSGPIFGLPYWIASVASIPNSASASLSSKYLKIGGIVGGL